MTFADRSPLENFAERILAMLPGYAFIYNLRAQRPTYISPQATHILGYTLDELAKLTWSTVIHPDDFPAVQNAILAAALNPHTPYTVEYSVRHKSGDWRWLSTTFDTLDATPESPAQNVIGTALDITGRKRAEEALRRQAERLQIVHEIDRAILAAESLESLYAYVLNRLRRLLNAQQVSLILVNEDFTQVSLYASDSEPADSFTLPSTSPLSPDEIESFRSGEGIAVADIRALTELSPALQSLKAQGAGSTVGVPMIAQGHVIGGIQVIWRRARAFDEEHLAIVREVANQVAVAVRQTRLYQQIQQYTATLEQQVAERTAALREREAMLRTLIDTAADAIIVTDEQKRIELFNRAAEELFGYHAAEVLGQPISVLVPEAQAPQHREYMERYALTGLPSIMSGTREMEGQRKNGHVFPVDITLSETRAGDRRLFSAIVRDSSERKRLEAERLQTELLRLELEKQRELIELKEQFVSMVTHEFRTPLTVIYSSCEILMRYATRLPPEKQMEHIQTIQSMSQRMVDLLNDVLLLSRGQAGKLPFDPAPLALEPFCAEILEHVRLSDHEAHPFRFETSGDLSPAMVDQKLLHSALVNLLNNAAKYTPAGKSITLRLAGQPDAVVIEVSDEGIGIPEEDQAHLFEPFHRAHNVQHIEGSGLGLPIVKHAMEAHGGTVSFVSTLNVGTTFTLRLPR